MGPMECNGIFFRHPKDGLLSACYWWPFKVSSAFFKCPVFKICLWLNLQLDVKTTSKGGITIVTKTNGSLQLTTTKKGKKPAVRNASVAKNIVEGFFFTFQFRPLKYEAFIYPDPSFIMLFCQPKLNCFL
jgi:hypothetical protein